MKKGQDLKSHLDWLRGEADKRGASLAVLVSAEDIVLDERARLKCLVPLCRHYNRDLLCPPNVLPISHFKEALKNYQYGLLVKVDVPAPIPVEERSRDLFRASKLKLYEIIARLEALALERGYPFAAGLVAGSCGLCDECVGIGSGLPCRHPFKARPSMEALGIDVSTTAQKAGVTLSFAPDASRSWIGLLLIG